MKYFIDTEFSERGPMHPIELISIGIVSEECQELYLCNASFDPKNANEWVRTNVLPHLPPRSATATIEFGSKPLNVAWATDMELASLTLRFISGDREPEFWGYYSDYDYVVFSQLFGGMEHYPQGWPYLFHDLRQWLDHEALYHVSQPDDAPHDALADARWIRDTYQQYREAQKITPAR